MSKKIAQNTFPPHSPIYEIRVMGHLGPEWSSWFEGMTLTLDPTGETCLSGSIADQATLHGLLKKVRDLGLPLISIIQVNKKE